MQIVTESWTLHHQLDNIFYFSSTHIGYWSKTCICLTCTTEVTQTPSYYEITWTKVFSPPSKKSIWIYLKSGETSEETLCILGKSKGCTHLLSREHLLGKYYSAKIQLLMISNISRFISSDLWTLFCHSSQQIALFVNLESCWMLPGL